MILSTQIFGQNSKASTIVLIHGMGSASSAFKPLLEYLRKDFVVVTIDLPGHGKTPMDKAQPMDAKSLAKTIFESIETNYGISTFHVVGNSLGGWIALEMAVFAPERIKSLTALAPAGLWLAPFTGRYPGTAIANVLARSLRLLAPLMLKFAWVRKIGFADVSPQWQNYSYEICLDAALAMATCAGYYPAWDATLKKRFDSKVSEKVPVTIIFGDSDKTLPAQTCQERSLSPEHSQWHIFKNCGHAPMWDYPEECVELIRTTAGVIR